MSLSAISPLSASQSATLQQLVGQLSSEQLTWVSGFFSGLTARGELPAVSAFPQTFPTPAAAKELTILYGSHTGNGKSLARSLQRRAVEAGLTVNVQDMATFRVRQLKDLQQLALIVSTHGEGEPPAAAKELYDYLHSQRAPRLEQLQFSVLALGDRSYAKFCQTGKDFDKRLEELGAKRTNERVDCDVVFKKDYETWAEKLLAATSAQRSSSVITASPLEPDEAQVATKWEPATVKVLAKQSLHGRDSDRQTIHLELEAPQGLLNYQPGDALGIWPANSPAQIDAFLAATGLHSEEQVTVGENTVSLYEALFRHFELGQATPDVLQRVKEAGIVPGRPELIADPERLRAFIHGKTVAEVFAEAEIKPTANQAVEILRPMQPRLYSISSSPVWAEGEVHITVAVVRYETWGTPREGICSCYLADQVHEGDLISVYIQPNDHFRLPERPETPVIMIGAGTGVAPFRSFVQHREATGENGRNWLFFGNRYFESEFLYQTEWHNALKDGVLTRMDVAFSRQGTDKVYVQHRMRENAKELYNWVNDGAHIYVCGDMKHLAPDVEKALTEIIMEQGQMTWFEASDYVLDMQREKRYQKDVY